jgi:hypothetical protein
MDLNEAPVSHADLYHKLGRMEALLETMMASIGNFQIVIKDIHTRIDALEARQNTLENSSSSAVGAKSALTSLLRDYAIPILAVGVTWLVAREYPKEHTTPKPVAPAIHQQLGSISVRDFKV